MRKILNAIFLSIFFIPFVSISYSSGHDAVTTIERAWLTEAEFNADSTLHARPGQVVLLDLEPAASGWGKWSGGAGRKNRGGGRGIQTNSLKFLIEKGRNFSFCIPNDEPLIRRIKLKQNRGRTLVNVRPGDPCDRVSLEPGRYSLDIMHKGQSVGDAGVQAFLHQPESSEPPSMPTMDFWVFRGLSGGFVTNATTESAHPLATIAETVSTSEVWRPTVVSRIGYNLSSASNGSIVQDCKEGGDDDGPLSWLFTGPPGNTCQFANGLNTKNEDAVFQIYNYGDTFTLFQFDWLLLSGSEGVLNVGTEKKLKWGTATVDNVAATFTTEYEGYDCDTPCVDDTTLPLETGQIALYKGCNYQGPAFVFMAENIDDMSIYADAAAAGLGISTKEARSLRLGEDTIAKLYLQTNKAGTPLVTASDIPCLDDTEFGNDNLKSFEIIDESAIDYIVSSQGCSQCILTGIDFSNQDFTNYDFTGSVFIGANLDGTNFHGANLDDAELSSISSASLVTTMVGTIFNNSQLHCISFSGSDISSSTFEGITIARDFSCYFDLQDTTIAFSNFDKADWRYMDLSGSTMTGVPDSLSTVSEPLDLSGTTLSNVTWLAEKKLDGVNLGCYGLEADQTTVCPAPNGKRVCSTLQGISLVGASLERACMSQAAMEGAFLTRSNLDGADLSGAQLKAINEGSPATLDGAFMRNVTLSGADLTGVSANNVNFYTVSGGQADATGVIAPGADFSGSYLGFADFSGSVSNLQSTTWTNAMLLGANFEQVDLSINTSGGVNSGTATKFSGAYMQGTQLQDAILDNVNFVNTYWDALGSGGKLNFLIPKQNLEFTGYWKDIDLPECPLALSYADGIFPPTNVTNANNTCPDGGPGPCDTSWGNSAQDISLAFFQSAVPPSFPQDPTASSELQCGNNSNPVDLCWITTNNPTLCPENVLN
jgi:uncharacterized protein YjbI with pentapeptide repeats